MSVAERIKSKLEAALEPASLDIKDESHLHAGHAGAPDGGESHFRITVVAAVFDGLNRVARQRLVNAALKEELAGPVHALAMTALTPDEAAARQGG
ncbi:MAG: BolA family protein [Pseudomonadota bacterium]